MANAIHSAWVDCDLLDHIGPWMHQQMIRVAEHELHTSLIGAFPFKISALRRTWIHNNVACYLCCQPL